jgi:homospermidine synthase
MREAMAQYTSGPTACVTHGNPGYVTHLTKRALLNLENIKRKTSTPQSKEQWCQLMKNWCQSHSYRRT